MRLLAIAASLCVFALSAKAQVPKATELWFGPSSDWHNTYPDKSTDYQQLFSNPLAAWPITYRSTKAFVLNVRFAGQGPVEELTEIINFVNKAGIGLAVTFPGILVGSNGCGKGIEGYYSVDGAPTREAQRIANLGGNIEYAVIDTPFYFGHLDPGACQFSVDELAKRVAASVQEIKKVFPFVKVRENEAPRTMAPALSDVRAYYQALANNGVVLDGVFFGVTGGRQSPPEGQSVISVLADLGIPYGLILLGSGQDTSDATWATDAQQKLAAWAAYGLNPQPKTMEIASWQPYPKHILPENVFGSLTSLAAWYIKQAGIQPLR
jgi:hypothetical protein